MVSLTSPARKSPAVWLAPRRPSLPVPSPSSACVRSSDAPLSATTSAFVVRLLSNLDQARGRTGQGRRSGEEETTRADRHGEWMVAECWCIAGGIWAAYWRNFERVADGRQMGRMVRKDLTSRGPRFLHLRAQACRYPQEAGQGSRYRDRQASSLQVRGGTKAQR